MRRSIVSLGLIIGLALPATAQSSPWNRGCGRSGGFLTNSGKNQVSGPIYVGMTAATAESIARRVGPGEFGYHFSASRDIPCGVAQAVAFRGANAWEHWSGNNGVVGAGWIGYATGPYFGRFTCTGWNDANGLVHESCHHYADAHAGAITVQFIISGAG